MAKVRGRGKVGDVLKIDLGNGVFGFGRILDSPLMGFYDLQSREAVSIVDVVKSPMLFRVWVMNYAVKSDNWEILGNLPLEDALKVKPRFFKQDPLNKKYSIYYDSKDTPAAREDCIGLERAAVWNPEHVENRLRNHFAGVPDPMTERLKVPDA